VGYAATQGLIAQGNQGLLNDVVFVPIIEEIFYRGVIQKSIEKVQGAWNRYQGTQMDETSTRNRVLASSMIFGAAHSGLKNQIEHTWNLGRGTGYLYEKTGSLFAPISLHMTHNLIANTSLRNYIYQGMDYPVLFYLLGKKILPIPDCITKPITSMAGKVAGWFTGKKEEAQAKKN